MAFLPARPNRREANDAYQMCHPARDGLVGVTFLPKSDPERALTGCAAEVVMSENRCLGPIQKANDGHCHVPHPLACIGRRRATVPSHG
jgi:hypothetical protein